MQCQIVRGCNHERPCPSHYELCRQWRQAAILEMAVYSSNAHKKDSGIIQVGCTTELYMCNHVIVTVMDQNAISWRHPLARHAISEALCDRPSRREYQSERKCSNPSFNDSMIPTYTVNMDTSRILTAHIACKGSSALHPQMHKCIRVVAEDMLLLR
jgi:hypothetical protein